MPVCRRPSGLLDGLDRVAVGIDPVTAGNMLFDVLLANFDADNNPSNKIILKFGRRKGWKMNARARFVGGKSAAIEAYVQNGPGAMIAHFFG